MPYTCTWSHNSTAITMVKKPVLNQEWDFSLGAEKSLNEGTCRQGWGTSKEKTVNPHGGSQTLYLLSNQTLCITCCGSTKAAKGEGRNGNTMNSRD